MDIVVASASTIPIVVLCYVEAFNSGKLVTNASLWFYLVCLFATLFLILAHHVWNQIEVRKIWKSQNELYEEKKILETILLDMLPPEYAEKIVRSIDIGGKTQKAVVLFSDLKGYSKLNERLSPHDVISTPLFYTACPMLEKMCVQYIRRNRAAFLDLSLTTISHRRLQW
jgi:hypothetical protein